MKWHRLSMTLMIVFMEIFLISFTYAQSLHPDMPNDLIFTVRSMYDIRTEIRGDLFYFDTGSLESNQFYSQPMHAMVQALSWSPHGRYLAILCHSQEETNHKRQICILTHTGALQARFDNIPQQQAPAGYSPKYHITWSEDEQYVYFITKEGEVYRLVEADIHTGEIVRVLYENSDGLDHPSEYGSETFFTWTDDLEYIVVGIGLNGWRMQNDLVTFVINLSTGEEVDLISITEITGAICPYFSPLNNYLVGIYHTSYDDNRFVVFNLSGDVIYEIRDIEGPSISCPTWREDESAFYFVTEGLDIYQYSLVDERLEQIFSNPYYYIISIDYDSRRYEYPLVLSPDGNYLAFTVGVFGEITTYNPMVLNLLTGEWYEYDTLPAAYPLWVPNEP